MIDIISDFLWRWIWLWLIIISLFCYIKYLQLPWSDKKFQPQSYRLFFLSLAASMGLGSILVVMNGVLDHGVEILIWIWIGIILGKYIKFWELYFSLIYQDKNHLKGPVSYINILGNKWLRIIFLICQYLYSWDVFQWRSLNVIMVDVVNFYIPHSNITVNIILLLLLFFNGRYFITINNSLMKLFFTVYTILFTKIIFNYHGILMDILSSFNWVKIFKWSIIAEGIKIAVYTGDLGLGYEGFLENYNNEIPMDKINYCKNFVANSWIVVTIVTMSAIIALILKKIYHYNYNPGAHVMLLRLFMDIFNKWGPLIWGLLVFSITFSTISTLYQYSNFIFNYYNKSTINFMKIFNLLLFFMINFFSMGQLFQWMMILGAIMIMINTFIIGKMLNKYSNIV